MIENARRHKPGTFAQCPNCHREPIHTTVMGGSVRDRIFTFNGTPSTRHQLSCACRRSTALQPSLEAAKAEWGERLTQLPLALPAPAPKRRRAA